MMPIFADTFYYLGLLNPADPSHARALAYSKDGSLRYVTTEYVLLEVGNALCRVADRGLFVALEAGLATAAGTTIVPASDSLWRRAISLYAKRPDKNWSLTDCASFVVMTERNMTDALTGDHHFEQAGFTAILK